jgi:DtxR family Mn-dependent transcriptional regulator
MGQYLTDKAEEILEHLWIKSEEEPEPVRAGILPDGEVNTLLADGLVEVEDGQVELTETGTDAARSCIRRHRLAERLLSDILDGSGDEVHEAGCKFEHGLHEGLERKVCTMLGHPRRCPHGSPIPRGECCRQLKKDAGQLLAPVTQLEEEETGVVAYLESEDREDLRKLMAMGTLPGVELTVKQRFPSFLLRMDESSFAVDEELAGRIYVRRVAPDSPSA